MKTKDLIELLEKMVGSLNGMVLITISMSRMNKERALCDIVKPMKSWQKRSLGGAGLNSPLASLNIF